MDSSQGAAQVVPESVVGIAGDGRHASPVRHLIWRRFAALLLTALVGCQGGNGTRKTDDSTPGLQSTKEPLDGPKPANRGWVAIKPRAGSTEPGRFDAEIERLRALGYVSGSKPQQAGLIGVTLHKPELATPGLSILISGHGHEALLMDASGKILHKWRKEVSAAFPGQRSHAAHFRKVYPFPNGDLIVLYANSDGMVKLDRCSNVLWASPNQAHHDFEVQPNGDIYTLIAKVQVNPQVDPVRPIREEYVAVLDPSGKEKRRVSLVDALIRSDFKELWEQRKNRTGDVLHANSVDVLGGKTGALMKPWRPGQVLVSIRHLNMIAVLDMVQQNIVWAYQGGFKLQHDAQLLANGHILLFDNVGLGGESRILELDVKARKTAWEYRGDPRHPFFSDTRGRVQRFSNGNTLISETDSGRAFEVTSKGEIVWEFFNPERAGPNGQFIAALLDMLRLPADFPTDWIAPCPVK